VATGRVHAEWMRCLLAITREGLAQYSRARAHGQLDARILAWQIETSTRLRRHRMSLSRVNLEVARRLNFTVRIHAVVFGRPVAAGHSNSAIQTQCITALNI
jgi:hypothetical protein